VRRPWIEEIRAPNDMTLSSDEPVVARRALRDPCNLPSVATLDIGGGNLGYPAHIAVGMVRLAAREIRPGCQYGSHISSDGLQDRRQQTAQSGTGRFSSWRRRQHSIVQAVRCRLCGCLRLYKRG
jgi:hypothetical protein